MHEMRRLMTLCEAAFDLGSDDDFDAAYDQPPPVSKPPLSYAQQRLLKQRKAKRSPNWSEKERQRRGWEEEDESASRIAKSLVGYKPFKIPLIRFGKFGKQSTIHFDAEFRAELGNVSREPGVSAFTGMPHRDGYLVVEPHTQRAVYDNRQPFALIRRVGPELIAYLDHGTPVDVFLMRGHLVSSGDPNYLTLGSDGEYLLDTRKPYRSLRLAPEQVYMRENMNLLEYFDRVYGIGKLRHELEIERAEQGDA